MALRRLSTTDLQHAEADGKSAARDLVKRWWNADLDPDSFILQVGAWPGYKDWPGGWPLADASLGALVRADSSDLKGIGLNVDQQKVSAFQEILINAPGGTWPLKPLTLREPMAHESLKHPQQILYLEDGLHRGLAIAGLFISRRIVPTPVAVFFGEIT